MPTPGLLPGHGYCFCSFVPPLGFAAPASGRAIGDAEEEEPVPLAPGDFLRDGGEGLVASTAELEAVVEDLDHNVAALELTSEQSSGQRQPRGVRRGYAAGCRSRFDLGGTRGDLTAVSAVW